MKLGIFKLIGLTALFSVSGALADPINISIISVSRQFDVYVSTHGNDQNNGQSPVQSKKIKGLGPVLTLESARAIVAKAISEDANRNFRVVFEAGTYFLPKTEVFTTADSPGVVQFPSPSYSPSPYTVTYTAAPGATVIWSGGTDISETFSATKLPGGSEGCVSHYLKAKAPLTNERGTASSYVGTMWVNGQRAMEVIYPRKGNEWHYLPGTPPTIAGPGADVGSLVPYGATALFDQYPGSKSLIQISDLSFIGKVGDTIAFNPINTSANAGPVLATKRYWILSKKPLTKPVGAGVITLADSPNGKPIEWANVPPLTVQDPVQSVNWGDRRHQDGSNSFPIYSADLTNHPAGPNSQPTDLSDVKIQLGLLMNLDLAPIAGINLGAVPNGLNASAPVTEVTLNSHTNSGTNIWAETPYRVWNDFGHLGEQGYGGEVYTDRKSGDIYYSLRDGETCSNISVIIPRLDQLVRVSNSVYDAQAAFPPFPHAHFTPKTGILAGNIVFSDITFAHTQTSVLSGAMDAVTGQIGGYFQNESSHYTSLVPAIATIGAANVVFDHVTLQNTGGSGFGIAYGSSHITIENSTITDIGGSAIIAGGLSTTYGSYLYGSDQSATPVITPEFGASTQDDFKDASNCCQTITRNTITNFGVIDRGVAGVAIAQSQNFEITYNTILHGPFMGLTDSSDAGVNNTPKDYGGLFARGSFGTNISHNEIGYCGYEQNARGDWIAGASLGFDFGCFYIEGPQDGTNGAQPRMTVSYNRVHDVSSAAWKSQYYGGAAVPGGHGFDAVLDYHDGSNTFGVNEFNNVFYNTCTAGGYPSRISQHTGNMRTEITNNIFAACFNSFTDGDYSPAATMFPKETWLPQTGLNCNAKNPCYVVNEGELYTYGPTVLPSPLPSTGNAGPPACATGGSCNDGKITWIHVMSVPSPKAEINKNITIWETPEGTADNSPELSYITQATANVVSKTYGLQFFNFANNTYYSDSPTQDHPRLITTYNFYSDQILGFTLANWQGPASGQSCGQDMNSSFNNDPNFLDWRTGNFNFQQANYQKIQRPNCPDGQTYSPACAIGFVPWDYTDVGANAPSSSNGSGNQKSR